MRPPGQAAKEGVTRYEIRVEGIVRDELASFVGDMTSFVRPTETVVRGTIVDRSALHGLLDHIQSLGLELIAVRSLPDADAALDNDDVRVSAR